MAVPAAVVCVCIAVSYYVNMLEAEMQQQASVATVAKLVMQVRLCLGLCALSKCIVVCQTEQGDGFSV